MYFKDNLNPTQKEAVLHAQGPALVIAGAGTGKTRVIEYRVLNLIQKGVEPERILLLTFTRNAASEMLKRAAWHNKSCEHVAGGTFHSVGYKFIRQFADVLHLEQPISFLDEADTIEAFKLLTKNNAFFSEKLHPKPDTLQKLYMMRVNRVNSLEEMLAIQYPHFLEIAHSIERLFEMYQVYKRKLGLIDYNDMLVYFKILLETATVGDRIRGLYDHIMVDEFQDTNLYTVQDNHHKAR